MQRLFCYLTYAEACRRGKAEGREGKGRSSAATRGQSSKAGGDGEHLEAVYTRQVAHRGVQLRHVCVTCDGAVLQGARSTGVPGETREVQRVHSQHGCRWYIRLLAHKRTQGFIDPHQEWSSKRECCE